MNMKEINQMTEDIYNQKMAKREAENTALDGCADDLSDVSFKLGTPSIDIAAVKIAIVFTAIFSGRLIWRRLPEEMFGSDSSIIIKTVMLVVIAAAVLFFLMFFEGKKARISVKKTVLSYKGRDYDAKAISHIIIEKLGGIKVYSKGKIVARASQGDDNAEMLIAWAKKCKINIIDRRNKM